MPKEKGKIIRNEKIILLGFSVFTLILHLYTNAFASYGIFRDELYYIACSNRLDWGYVDQPPLSIFILAVNKLLFGDSLFALRLLPALTSGGTIFVTGLITRKMGGDKIAIIISSLAVTVAPIFIGMNTVYSMNCFDMLLWVLVAYTILCIIKEGKTHHWVFLGIVLGLGMLNKISFLWLGAGLFLGLLLTDQRKHFLTIWPYFAALLALIIFLPYIIWNINHNFAHLEFIHNATTGKYSSVTRLDFILGQILLMNPVSMFIWLPGFYYYFIFKEGKTFRILGIIFLTTYIILLISGHSKPEYIAAAYPLLFAAGGIMIEKISFLKTWFWIKYTIISLLIISGIFILPHALPILSIETYIQFSKIFNVGAKTYEGKELSELPQYYADMFGWENMAKTISEVYDMIPQNEKSKTIIIARNYGEAGAIEYYSRNYKLTPVISMHNNYWIWGWEYRNKDYQTFIVIGGTEEDHLKSAQQVERVAIIRCKYCMPYENNRPVFIYRRLKRSFEEIWNSNKHFE